MSKSISKRDLIKRRIAQAENSLIKAQEHLLEVREIYREAKLSNYTDGIDGLMLGIEQILDFLKGFKRFI